MKKILIPAVIFLLVLSSCTNKDEPSPTPTPPPAPTVTSSKGGVLFWTSTPLCGNLTIQLSTGQQSNIVGYYPIPPGNCVNQVGGYFYLDAGTYSYSVSSAAGCSIAGGTIKVLGNQCNIFKVL